MRAFLTSTSLSEDYRHYIQHLRSDLSKNQPSNFPVWGSLSWVDNLHSERSHIAILGAQVEGTSYSGCVFDTVERRWVSKVCLAIGQSSFNFDLIFESANRFESFILPYLMEKASSEVKFHEKLPIITLDLNFRVP